MLNKKWLYKNGVRVFKKQLQASKCLTFSKDARATSKPFLKMQRTFTKPVIAINLV